MSRITYEACPKCRSIGRDTRGDNLVVYDNGHSHCFACHYHVFPKLNQPRKPVEYVAKSVLPFDFTREVPTQALQWLLQYGLPYSYWESSIGYSPKDQRLIFLVGQPVAFSTGRYVGPTSTEGKQPKRWFHYGDPRNYCEVIRSTELQPRSPLVLVEDLISAHKVAQCDVASTPLFGTDISPATLYTIRNWDGDIILWLDKDQEHRVHHKAMNLEMLSDHKVKVIVTDKDPKSLSFNQIKKELNENC